MRVQKREEGVCFLFFFFLCLFQFENHLWGNTSKQNTGPVRNFPNILPFVWSLMVSYCLTGVGPPRCALTTDDGIPLSPSRVPMNRRTLPPSLIVIGFCWYSRRLVTFATTLQLYLWVRYFVGIKMVCLHIWVKDCQKSHFITRVIGEIACTLMGKPTDKCDNFKGVTKN